MNLQWPRCKLCCAFLDMLNIKTDQGHSCDKPITAFGKRCARTNRLPSSRSVVEVSSKIWPDRAVLPHLQAVVATTVAPRTEKSGRRINNVTTIGNKLGSEQSTGYALSLSRAAPHQDDWVCICEKGLGFRRRAAANQDDWVCICEKG
jgi:hypothetical protein